MAYGSKGASWRIAQKELYGLISIAVLGSSFELIE